MRWPWYNRQIAAIFDWQGEQAAIHFFEPGVFGLGVDLAKDRSVERGPALSGLLRVAPPGLAHKPSTCIASTIALQFIGCFALGRTAIAASIWLIFLSAGFDSLAACLATVAFFLVVLIVAALLASLESRLVLVSVLVAMFMLPCFETCVSRWRRCQRWSHSYL